MKKLHYLFLTILSLTILTSCNSYNEEEEKIEFTILQINDVYEIAPIGDGAFGGLARVATLKKQLLEENPNTISVLSGDFLNPSLIGNLSHKKKQIKGAQMVETLNTLGLDYVTFGNHEFDLKEDQLIERINESKFEWVSSNVSHKTSKGTIAFEKKTNENTTALPRYKIHTIKGENGEKLKIGIIGLTLDFNKKDYVEYTEVNQTAKNTYNEIKDKCDIVIGITHLSIEQDKKLAEEVPQIPILLGGHEHNNMLHQVGNTIIAKADANAKTAFVHRVSFNIKTKEVNITPSLISIDQNIEQDSLVKSVVDKWQSLAEQSMTNMGFAPKEIIADIDSSWEAREYYVRSRQTNIGKIIAKSMLYTKPSSDLAIIHSGSIRIDDELTGKISQSDIMRLLPYGGPIVTANLKGSILKKMLDISETKNLGAGGYLQYINISGSRSNGWSIKGKPLNENKIYKTVLPSFLVEGREANLEFLKGTKYYKPTKIGPHKVKNDARDILIDYLKNNNS